MREYNIAYKAQQTSGNLYWLGS